MAEAPSAESFRAAFPASLNEQIRSVLSAATRAPSTHNSQPWQFRISGGAVEVHADPSVVLPLSDTHGRYAHISIGFLLHHALLLAAYAGMDASCDVVLDGTHKATIRFSEAKGWNDTYAPMVEALFARRNRRGLFAKDTPLPAALIDALRTPTSFLPAGLSAPEVAVATDRTAIEGIADFTLANMVKLYGNPQFRAEMASWIVPTGYPRNTGIPGYSLEQPLIVSWILPTIIRLKNIGKIPGGASRAAIASAPALLAFGGADAPKDWLAIGMQASHGVLSTVMAGFDASVFVASLEQPDTRQKDKELLGLHGDPQFILALGKLTGEARWRTPRVPLERKLMKA